MTLPILAALLVPVVGGVAFAVVRTRTREDSLSQRPDVLGALAEEAAAPPAPVTWPRRVGAPGELNAGERLRLLDDLVLLRASWCIAALEDACAQETDPALREAARRALTACRDQRSASSA